MINTSLLESGEYYLINGTKILYWDGTRWLKPVKNSMGSYCGLLGFLNSQPKIIKTAIKTTEPKS